MGFGRALGIRTLGHCARRCKLHHTFEGSLGAARLNARVQVGNRPDAIRCVHMGRSHKHHLSQNPSTKVYWFKGFKPQANSQTYTNTYTQMHIRKTYTDQISPPLRAYLKTKNQKSFSCSEIAFSITPSRDSILRRTNSASMELFAFFAELVGVFCVSLFLFVPDTSSCK
jgi:hypothetical protein